MYRVVFPKEESVNLELNQEGIVKWPISNNKNSSLLVSWKDIRKHMVRKPPDFPKASMKLDLKPTDDNPKPKPIVFDILGMINNEPNNQSNKAGVDVISSGDDNFPKKSSEDECLSNIMKESFNKITNIDALESLRKFVTLILKGKTFAEAKRISSELLSVPTDQALDSNFVSRKKDNTKSIEKSGKVRRSISSSSSYPSNSTSKKEKDLNSEIDPKWEGARLQKEREIALERSKKNSNRLMKSESGTLLGSKTDDCRKDDDLNTKNTQLRLQHQKEIEQKARQYVLKDVIIKEHYETMVLSGLISEEDFWASRQKNIQEAKSKLRKSIAFSSSILKDIEEKIEEIGNMADLAIASNTMQNGEDQIGQKSLTIALEKRHIEYIFNLYPKVKELYIREVISKQMSEVKFWSDFARSLRVHRGGQKASQNNKYFETGRVEKLGHDSSFVDQRRVEGSINLMNTFSETRYKESVDQYDFRTHDHQERSANLGNKYNRHGALLITSYHVPTLDEETELPDLFESSVEEKFSSSLELKGGQAYYTKHQNVNGLSSTKQNLGVDAESEFLESSVNRSRKRRRVEAGIEIDANKDILDTQYYSNCTSLSFTEKYFLLSKRSIFDQYQRLELRLIMDKIQKSSLQQDQSDDIRRINNLPQNFHKYILREYISGTTELLRHFFTFYLKVKQYKENKMEKKRKYYFEKMHYLKEKLESKKDELESRINLVLKEYDKKETIQTGQLCAALVKPLLQQIIAALNDYSRL